MYKLAIFDFDGTLVDSAPGIVDVMRQCVEEYNFSQSVYEQWQLLIGVPLLRQLEIILPSESEAFWEEVVQRYRDIYDSQAIEICPPFPGLLPMLDRLADAGVQISIASSKRRHLIETVLDHHKITARFSLIVGAQDVENHKPHPESVHHTLGKLSVDPLSSIVIGDSSYDLDMARDAGVDAIGVTTGIHTAEILSKSEPNHIVSRLEDVAPIILNGRGVVKRQI